MTGIIVSSTELLALARRLRTKYSDEFIPIPEKETTIICSEEVHRSREVILSYWETETGSHGWCCSICGKVLQWG